MKRAAATKGRQAKFYRGAKYTIVGPSGHGTPIKILDTLSLDGNGRRGLLVALDRRGGAH